MPSASVIRRRLRLKEAGFCSQCTTPHLPGRTRCRKHLDKANELARRRNADRKTYGLCVRCPKKAAKDHVLCEECLARLRGRDIDWSEKNGKDRTLQQTRRSKGLCRRCDKPSFEGRSLCKEHLENDRSKVKAYRAERKAKGLCWRCDELARPGGVLCQHHRDEVTAKERKGKTSVGGALSSLPGQVVQKIDATPIPCADGARLRKDTARQPMVPIENDRLRVDAATMANIIDRDRIDRTPGEQLLVEVSNPPDVPCFLHDPRFIRQVLLHRYVA